MFVTEKELIQKKLSSMNRSYLVELARSYSVFTTGRVSDIVNSLIGKVTDEEVTEFIKGKYEQQVNKRRSEQISDDDLRAELEKLESFNWGVVQGQLDQKIQRDYVRVFCRYEQLIKNVKDSLHDSITDYALAAWYNHWSTVLVEDYIALHPRVTPTLKNNFGVDIFFDKQPFDLKITYLPKGYELSKAKEDPQDIAVWMYENQGAQRFGADNRMFVVLADENSPENSWKLKRDFTLLNKKISGFFSTESVTKEDEIAFTFNNRSYTAVSKVLLITK